MLLFGTVSQATAEEDVIVTGKFVVSLKGESGQRAWVVKALEQNVYRDLAGYTRVVPVQKSPNESARCPGRDVDCLLKLYDGLGIDGIMLGTVDRSEIDFEIYDVVNKFLVNTGSINIGRGASLLKLRLGAFNAFKIFIGKGGILDDRYGIVDEVEEEAETNQIVDVEVAGSSQRLTILISMAAVTCLPFLLSVFSRSIRHPERARILMRGIYPFMILSLGLLGLQFTLEPSGTNIINIFLDLFDGFYWIMAGLGGAAWGCFLIAHFKIVVPHLMGLERIEQRNLGKLLRSCLTTLVVKSLVVAAFYGVVFYGVLYLGQLFAVRQDATILILFPTAGLYVFCWVALILDVFAMSIDMKISATKLNFKNEWNQKIRTYFLAYLKRNGISIDENLVNEVAFIPGNLSGVVAYSGGFSRPRIAIAKDLLIFALGDIEEAEAEEILMEELLTYDERYVEPELRQFSLIQILGKAGPAKKAKILQAFKDKKRNKHIEKIRSYFQRDLSRVNRNLGAINRDLYLGYISPALDGNPDNLSLMTGCAKDMRVFEDFLVEYSKRHEPHDEAEEVDDSSEFDMDFLFGALLHKFGGILRYDTIFSTTSLYFTGKKNFKESRFSFPFAKHFALISDTFVVLNFGLNHLIQHLYYKTTNDPSHLTYKGLPSLTLESQAKIMYESKQLIESRRPPWFRTDELERITWLSRFSPEPIERDDAANSKSKRIFRLSLFTSLIGLAALAGFYSFIYHPEYVQEIAIEEQKIADAIEKAEKKAAKEAEIAAKQLGVKK